MRKDNISEDKHFVNILLLIADKDIKFRANQLISHYSISNNNKETKPVLVAHFAVNAINLLGDHQGWERLYQAS
jgi:hypothetical protein